MMTIDEAIYELEDGLRGLKGYLHEDYNNALQLGIEALKFIQKLRGNEVISSSILLPGETK